MLKCWTFFIDIQRVRFSAPSACLSPFPSACHSPILPQEISQDWYLKQGRHKRGPVGDCIACDHPKKDRVSRGRAHPTTAESWIALPATLPRRIDRVSRGREHPTTAESWGALCPADFFEHFPHPAPGWPTPSTMMTHTQLHEPHPAPQPTPYSMVTHT